MIFLIILLLVFTSDLDSHSINTTWICQEYRNNVEIIIIITIMTIEIRDLDIYIYIYLVGSMHDMNSKSLNKTEFLPLRRERESGLINSTSYLECMYGIWIKKRLMIPLKSQEDLH